MSAKQKQLIELFDAKDSRAKAVVKALTGGKVNLADMFEYSADEEAQKIKIEFGTEDYETKALEIEELLGLDYYYLEKLKAIHDWATLEKIVPGGMSLSAAKVAIYEAHRQDLILLKRVVKRHLPDRYKEIFSDPSIQNNYVTYVGTTKKNGRKLAVIKKCSQVDFNKYLTSVLKDIKTVDKDLDIIREKLETYNFLPKSVSKANAVLPNQLHFNELRLILKKAASYLPFLSEKDEEGLSTAEKIMQILTFKIPYYVGPLNNQDPNAQNTWVKRRTQEKITPWNFEKVVDVEASASEFISRMLSECTYLKGETVLPKQSILYSRFMVLNELNNLKINGEPISVALKQNIFDDLFLTRAKVTQKGLLAYLAGRGLTVKQDDITGIDGDFKASMKSLIDRAC